MKNKAKCKLCGDIIESFHASDLVVCSCGEISVDGGDAMRCSANDFNNFLRIDDKGNEVKVSVVAKESVPLKKEDKLTILNDMISSFENLPEHGLQQHATNYDILSVLYLLKSLFSDC